ncbi:ribosomal-protein-alanine N-acetyltransferase [Actinosynnema sp. ALI-1.44]|uniref:ribosomal protein S18-alanine N-acetyltransferase n=1 Tax=Actinosynnema sp. ALI-1.44 TaxID=1933779 RepID=UPI00097C2A19|nr:ribosomal protein S18-alanine N-acetyltransferase [Actinosynnema sp. ALI-1.44]ONI73382.1 ribosomal-protein-alanine N-acetyltransferase [Actinosynnema sp. ALI-1.44]
MTVRLEPLRGEDLSRCAELEKVLFPGEDPWSVQAFQFELETGNHYVGAHAEPGGLVGYAGIAMLGTPGNYEGEIHTIGVDPDHQGKGIGKALLRDLLDHADEAQAPVFLEVRTDNVPAIRLYKAHGFQQIGLRRRYYQPSGADAYTMARPGRSSE